MKITQYVDYGGGDVEMEIGLDEIVDAIRERSVRADSVQLIQRSLIDYYQFLKAIPDEMIAALSPQLQQVVHHVLSEQVARFSVQEDTNG